MAFSPAGVAAQPRPKILAITLVVIYSLAGCSRGSRGNMKFIKGAIARDARLMTPLLWAISINPTHNAIIPAMVIHSVTASPADSSAASVNSGSLPCKAP